MEPTLNFTNILDHIVVSLLPWIMAMIAGGGIGYLIAFLIKRWTGSNPGIQPLLILFPWRAILAWVALVAVSSPILLFQFGLSLNYQIATNGIVLSMMVIPWAAHYFLHIGIPATRWGKILSIARSVAVLSIGITSILDFGIGFYLRYVSSMGDVQQMNIVFGVEGAMLVGIDVLLGFVQLLVTRRPYPAS
jgi:hypothetical protein